MSDLNKTLELARRYIKEGHDRGQSFNASDHISTEKLLAMLVAEQHSAWEFANALVIFGDQMRWIPVNEKPPTQRQDRIAVIVNGDILQDLHYYLEGRGFYRYAPPYYMTGIITNNVTHWMQLPEPTDD